MPRTGNDTERGASETDGLLGDHNSHNGSIGGKMSSGVKSLGRIVWFVLASNYVNVLLFFVPLGIIGGMLSWSPTVVFTLNFLAIIPLAALLSYATEEISLKVGETLGGLLNATFGNAVELIVSGKYLIYGHSANKSPCIIG